MNGGPSHVDTFDPKPMLDRHNGKPVPTNLPTERKTGAAMGFAVQIQEIRPERNRSQRSVSHTRPE